MSWMSKDRTPIDLVDPQKTVGVIREQAGLGFRCRPTA